MNELYKRIEDLCKSKGLNITQMCKESGAARGSLTDLKMNRITGLNMQTLNRISTYFGITIDELLGNEIKKEPVADVNNKLPEEFYSLSKSEQKQVKDYISFLLSQRSSD